MGNEGAAAGKTKVAVVVVDLQGDFTTHHQGTLAVDGTDQEFLQKTVETTESLKALGLDIYATQDWHPDDHMSFASNQQGKDHYEVIELADGRSQVLWPDHCVAGSQGAEILMDSGLFRAVVQKGMDPANDSYSGFKDDGGAETGLERILRQAGVGTMILYGLATDYCVKSTVLHGLEHGFAVVVIRDLCRGVAPDTTQAAWAEMEAAGAIIWPTLDLKKVKGL